MDAQKFLAEFGHIANAPGGIARLRKLILQLAISGRLTERESGDTSAQELINANRERQQFLVKQKKLKRQPEPKPVSENTLPWMLPEGWAWTRLGSVTNYGDAPRVEFNDVTDDVWVLELEDIEKGTSRLLNKVLASERKFKSTKNGFPAGAVLYGKLRPYLDKVLIADAAGVCTTEMSPISFYENIEAGYLRWYLKSPYFITYADGSTYGMNLPRLGTEAAREALFPFPPKKEQSRIVTKVDDLMGLCDKLEAQQRNRSKLQNVLRQSTLQAAAITANPFELQATWTHLETSFGRLFGAPESVGDLRTLVLELAVKGLLVEQSAADASAEQQLAAIKSVATSRSESRHTRTASYRPVEQVELDSALPKGWALARLGELVRVINGRAYSKPELLEKGTPVLRVGNLFTSKNWYYSNLELEPDKYCDAGDLLYAWSASFGPFIWTGPRAIFHYHIWKLELFSETHLSKEFLFTVLKKRTEAIKSSGHGIAMAHMTKEKMEQLPIAIPPLQEQLRISARVSELTSLCDALEVQLREQQKLAERISASAVASLTGTTIGREEDEPVKLPQTELIAPLYLGTPPDVKFQAPLATILARHNGEMSAKDLWQRFGGEIDAFYAQLKTEVTHGWVLEPTAAEMREKLPDTARA